MNLDIKFIDRGFFFVSDITLSPKDNEITIKNIETKSDSYIATVISAALIGRLELSEPYKDLVNLIRDQDLKKKLAKDASVSITETRTISIDGAEPTPISAPEQQPEVDPILGMLNGSVKKVVENIGSAKLVKGELEKLLNAERDGKNRTAVKAVLVSALG